MPCYTFYFWPIAPVRVMELPFKIDNQVDNIVFRNLQGQNALHGCLDTCPFLPTPVSHLRREKKSIIYSHPSARTQRSTAHLIHNNLDVYNLTAPASFNKAGNSAFRAVSSEFPPICLWLMKMLGTVRWPVISSRAFWMAEPSSIEPTPKQVSNMTDDRQERAFEKDTYQLDPAPSRTSMRLDPATTFWKHDSRGSRIWRRRLQKR